jgi:DNA-binding Lrp family transcriptional regulator
MPDWIKKLRESPASKDPANTVKNFKDDQQRQAAYDSRVRGVRTVALDRIVGSVGRYQDFDRQFRLIRQQPSERLQRIKQAMREGRVLPPVKLYQIKDDYYVLDGNHRIAAAKELKHDEIRAHIVEFVPSGNSLQDLLYRERADFADRTQLPGEIRLTEVGQYANLLEQIERHQAHLQNEEGRSCDLVEAAGDWFRSIYRPLQTIVRRGRLIDAFTERTLDDLCAYIAHHQWQVSRERRYGIGIDKLIPKDMEAFRSQMAELRESDYPEMQRGITAFILMRVQAKREYKIVEKLFELEEVVEVHSVHGEVDLLVKIVLTRDLLSSDAEIISQFVHENVRQLNGVISTQTLIPGFSKMKS